MTTKITLGEMRSSDPSPALGLLRGLRSVLALGALIVLCASANAARVRHPEPRAGHTRPAQPVAAGLKSYAVPGWTEQQTRDWMDSNTGHGD
jgi:hypothetical protein